MSLEELLLTVRKPARYSGGEWNSVKKDWTPDKVKFLLAFPDVYEVGMSYLGMKILYGIVNAREDCLCERTFSPWPDFEAALRSNKIDIFSLESRRPIREFDIIGFSLAYELNYTNVLNILDLGRIPLRSSERGDYDPLIVAGGPSCFNPEPIAEFIDAFVIGDGEEAVSEIIDRYKSVSPRAPGGRKGLLRELAGIKGVYVPQLFKVEYNSDRTIKSHLPIDDGMPGHIKKRTVEDFENSFYPTKQIVPNIEIVHDRIPIEILRGCKHACKFCLSGATYRPVRERSRGRIVKLAKESYEATGYEEISVLSLSSGDHSEIRELITDLNDAFKGLSVSISVPSLRIDDILSNLPVLLSQVRKAGLTFAPESASECLRKHINKNIDIEKLFAAIRESYKRGWNRVKLYFMIGLPTESDTDLECMSQLLEKISDLRKETGGRPANVTASINAFIPKPHTPFERSPMETLDGLNRKKAILIKQTRSRMVELDFNQFERGCIEGAFSRGDRALSAVLLEAWKSGAKFDGWSDFFNYGLWVAAFGKAGIDPEFYLTRSRGPEEILPWDFIEL